MLNVRRVFFNPRARPASAAAAAALRSLTPSRSAKNGAVLARTFASASSAPKEGPPRWHTPALLALTFVTYLACKEEMKKRPPPELKEHERLVKLSFQSLKKGDQEQGMKYLSEAYNATKDVQIPPENAVLRACLHGDLCEKIGQHASALPYYDMATKYIKAVEPLSIRCTLGVKVLNQMGRCYYHTEQHESAEKVFKKAIQGYEKFQGQL